MDTKTINLQSAPVTVNAQPSRLPAGSTLQLPNGVNVPHPHAEINLAGAGDPRAAESPAAVTEYIKSSVVPGHNPDGTLTPAYSEAQPLSENVLPRRLTVDGNAQELPEVLNVVNAGAAAPNPNLTVKQDPADKTFEAPVNEVK